ncbi:unnamed protein product [Agarophyton chilense]
MASELLILLTDGTTLCMVLTATLTAAYSAYRANEPLFKRGSSRVQALSPSLSEQFVDENRRLLEGSTALAFPIVATVSIIFLFFFIKSFGYILTLLSTVSSVFSVSFFLWPFAETIISRIRAFGAQIRSNTVFESLIVVPASLAIISYWLVTGNWLPNNVIGISLCVLFASLCKVPNLKVTVMLFAGLFVYDIFFVFFSERFFGRNVMVEVATSAPKNPASAIASFFNLPFTPVKHLALPAKLVFPAGGKDYAILGLGDIILPEILLTYLLEADLLRSPRRAPWYKGYFPRALVAYTLALYASFYCNFVFKNAQPALLYIVPALLVTTLIYARSKGEVFALWTGLAIRHSSAQVESDLNLDSDGNAVDPKDLESTALVA